MAHDSTARALSEIEFSIPSMACDGCAEKIRQTLTAIPGVRTVKPKLWRKRVLVSYDPSKVATSQIKSALAAAGFSASDAS